MALQQPDELAAFAGAYGRHCTLAAKALSEGHSREAVRVAGMGQGMNIHLSPLRRMRRTCNVAIDRALHAGNGWPALTERALEIKAAVEGEWQVRIPVANAAIEGA